MVSARGGRTKKQDSPDAQAYYIILALLKLGFKLWCLSPVLNTLLPTIHQCHNVFWAMSYTLLVIRSPKLSVRREGKVQFFYVYSGDPCFVVLYSVYRFSLSFSSRKTGLIIKQLKPPKENQTIYAINFFCCY